MPKAKYNIERSCAVCGTRFHAKTIDSIYCSRKCTNAAYRQRKKETIEQERRKQLEKSIPPDRTFITVREAILLYNIGRNTLYSLIRSKQIPSVNFGTRLIRLDREWLKSRYGERPQVALIVAPKTYNLEPDYCYTIGQVSKRFGVSPSTVYQAIRKFSIPMRQIGKYVYVPKDEVNNIFNK